MSRKFIDLSYTVEHLTGLDKLPNEGFNSFVVPAKILEFGAFLIRAFAIDTE